MGWFSSLVSGVVGTVAKVVEAVPGIMKKAKEVAAKTIGWLADEAETFVGDVQAIWRTVKPYISKARSLLQAAAVALPHPWAKSFALLMDRALAFIEKLDQQPLVQYLKHGVEWVVKMARQIKEKWLDEAEMAQAKANSAAFDQAIASRGASDAERYTLRVSKLINDYLLVRAQVNTAVNDEHINDFEHYLRIRAAQKLLGAYERVIDELKTLEQIDPDLFFIIEVSQGLLADVPRLSGEQTERLDALTTKLFGKPVVPFIFEEMIIAWAVDVENLDARWAELNKSLAIDKVVLRRFEMSREIESLTPGEEEQVAELNASTKANSTILETLAKASREKRNYVYAAEGFLQLLEKDEETLIAEDREYLAEFGAEVGVLLIECAQQGRQWETLEEHEKELITDFANIFKDECKARGTAFKEVEVTV
ncbi:hypothetical protein HMPREF1487_09066 [Pseudomonas sp. HPB0071]|nr:hypothetical protein HMPREF1487_09066 [Pseudomonas sp. HPB0071]